MIWMLHGNFGSPSDWRPVIEILEKAGHECRALNLWKYLECCPKSLKETGALIAAEIAALDPHPYLCGYSLGGRLAIHALLHDPSMWKGAIFVSTHPGLASEQERIARRESDAEWGVKCLEMPWPDLLNQWDSQPVFSPVSREKKVDDARLNLYPWRRSIARAFIDWSLGSQQDCRAALQACRVPCLWIAGADDPKFTVLARSVAGDNTRLVPACGHRVPMEAPAALASLIDSFTLPGCHAR